VHALPAQQGWPAPPQSAQLPLRHTVPAAEHESGSQQGSPAAPHEAHALFTHTTPLAVHCALPLPPPPAPGQHACPAPPHVPQLPLVHVPVMPVQVEPAAVHWWFTQQPVPQPFASQQG
jgi:hypothetical protein